MIDDIKVSKEKIKHPKNKFVLHLKMMHGDADHYTTEDIILDRNKAIEEWNMLSVLFDLVSEWDYLCEFDIIDRLKNSEQLQGIPDPDRCLDLIHYDVKYDGRRATPESMWMTYFDDDGVEYNIDTPERLGSKY
jgi:hypothetical protein